MMCPWPHEWRQLVQSLPISLRPIVALVIYLENKLKSPHSAPSFNVNALIQWSFWLHMVSKLFHVMDRLQHLLGPIFRYNLGSRVVYPGRIWQEIYRKLNCLNSFEHFTIRINVQLHMDNGFKDTLQMILNCNRLRNLHTHSIVKYTVILYGHLLKYRYPAILWSL